MQVGIQTSYKDIRLTFVLPIKLLYRQYWIAMVWGVHDSKAFLWASSMGPAKAVIEEKATQIVDNVFPRRIEMIQVRSETYNDFSNCIQEYRLKRGFIKQDSGRGLSPPDWRNPSHLTTEKVNQIPDARSWIKSQVDSTHWFNSIHWIIYNMIDGCFK